MGWQDAPIVGGEQTSAQPKWASAPIVDQAAPEQPAEQQPGRSMGQELGRQLQLTGRAAAEGVTDVASVFANPLATIMNAGLKAMGVDYQFPEQSGAMSQALTDAGVTAPENDTERLVNTIGRRAVGTGVTMGAGGAVASAPGATGQVGTALASNPVIQATSAVTGPVAGNMAREAGAGPIGQMAADLGGSMVPGMASFAAPAATRGGFRGGEQGRQTVERNVESFKQVGTTPSVGQATESRAMRGAESLLGRTPGSAGRVVAKAEQQADEISAAIEKRASQLSRKTTGEQAGRQIQRSISGEGGFVERFKSQQGKLFDELDQFVKQDSRVPLDNTMRTLATINADIPGAPSTSRLFKNARIGSIEGALKSDLDLPSPGVVKLSQAEDAAESMYRARDSAVQDSGRFSAFANDQARRADQFVPVPGQPRFPGRYSSFPKRAAEGQAAAAEAQNIAKQRFASAKTAEEGLSALKEAANAEVGTLPYEAIKKLRTLVGNELADTGLASDVPRSKWKALYAGLSEDLKAAADGSGPQAQAAWSRANNYTRAGMKRIEAIESVIERNGGPEAIFRAATANTKEGATTLRAVMQSVDDEGKKMVSATVLRRLGLAKPGQQGELGDAFSTETFLTNWNSLSQEARRTLFDRYGPRFRSDMDQVARVAANLRAGSQVFRNPSGTSQATNQAAAIGGLALAVVTGNMGAAGAIGGGMAGANLSARLMTNPRFVRWLAQTTKMPVGAYGSAVNSLAAVAKETGDRDLALAVAALEQEKQSQQQPNREGQDQ